MILSETWFMEGYIDFELQKYRLLAYLKDVKSSFGSARLYPYLSDIVAHYKNLMAFRENKKLLQDKFPKRIDKVDAQKLELVYERMLSDDDVMQELEQIIEYSLVEMKGTISEGAELFDFVERKMEVEPIGIMPLYKNEGYVFLHYGLETEVRVYTYTITLFEHRNAKYRGIKMEYVDTRSKTPANTYQQIKLDVIRDYRTLPNPAVFKLDCHMAFPLQETILPIAKRVLVKHIGMEAH